MTKEEKEEIKENKYEFDDFWILLLLPLIFYNPPKPTKVINIYMGDDE